MDKKEQNNAMDIILKPETAAGVYSNLQIVQHSPTEFIVDFVQMMPNCKPEVRSRVILSPVHAKKLLAALQDNISRYEQQIGEIVEPVVPAPGNISPVGKA